MAESGLKPDPLDLSEQEKEGVVVALKETFQKRSVLEVVFKDMGVDSANQFYYIRGKAWSVLGNQGNQIWPPFEWHDGVGLLRVPPRLPTSDVKGKSEEKLVDYYYNLIGNLDSDVPF